METVPDMKPDGARNIRDWHSMSGWPPSWQQD
jgi:hypothetical protein